MILEKNYVIQRSKNRPILYDVSYLPNRVKKPIVIFCHGYKGFKDWGAWKLVAKKFSEEGFFFLKFNFSFNGGTIEEPIDFPDLKAFGQNNFSKELLDLETIISLVTSSSKYELEADLTNISLIGHSRGGGIVLIKAEEDPIISNVITWAGVCDFKSRFQEQTETFSNWKKNGITFIENSRTKQQMPHEFQFYEDFQKNEYRFTIKRAVKSLKIPHLIIHGDCDTSVNIDEAYKLKKWNRNSELDIISKANHVFGAKHPWQKDELPKDLRIVIEKSVCFIRKKLSTSF